VGSPQQVWDHPASPFVYGFLGDVNLFHGRAHEGEVHFGSDHNAVRLDSPEHHDAQDAKAYAYVRPHDFDVQRFVASSDPQSTARPSGILARLSRAIVVGPTARLELIPEESTPSKAHDIIEVQIPAQQYRDLGLIEGELLVATPRNARVFVEKEKDFAPLV
jgi:sulfate transport system ATP-binding protein